MCTIPLDTAKVRLQLQKKPVLSEEDSSNGTKYKGLLATILTIANEEGLLALWKGIIPGLHRQCLYGGLRVGLYGPVTFFYSLNALSCSEILSVPFWHGIINNAYFSPGKGILSWECCCWRCFFV